MHFRLSWAVVAVKNITIVCSEDVYCSKCAAVSVVVPDHHYRQPKKVSSVLCWIDRQWKDVKCSLGRSVAYLNCAAYAAPCGLRAARQRADGRRIEGRQTDRRMADGWKDGRWLEGRQTDGRTADGWKDGRLIEGQMDRRMADGWNDGRRMEGRQTARRMADG